MAIPNPNPNIEDGKACDNKTYSSNKINSLITAATELPVPGAGDAGKVLTVNAGATGFELDPIPTELPATDVSDAGKVLTVNAAGTGYELDTPAASGLIVKKITWIGDESWSKDIEIPMEDINCTVLRIVARDTDGNPTKYGAEAFDWGSTYIQYSNDNQINVVTTVQYTAANKVHIVGAGQSTSQCFNKQDWTYEMYYTTWN